MTDLYEQQGDRDQPGPGHNLEREGVWERWQKKRTFVRALEGTYGDLTKALLDAPRVYSSRNIAWKGGPQHYAKRSSIPPRRPSPTPPQPIPPPTPRPHPPTTP